jgi:hypothetical protein
LSEKKTELFAEDGDIGTHCRGAESLGSEMFTRFAP